MVLTDMWMPDMDGEALVRAIRSRSGLAGLPVFVLTADVEMRETYADMGFTGLLLKPVTFDGLKGIVDQ
jgi:CheY-like chemotaxis protein